jgi:hypothetical protein
VYSWSLGLPAKMNVHFIVHHLTSKHNSFPQSSNTEALLHDVIHVEALPLLGSEVTAHSTSLKTVEHDTVDATLTNLLKVCLRLAL